MSMYRELTIGGINYRIRRLPTMQQIHITVRASAQEGAPKGAVNLDEWDATFFECMAMVEWQRSDNAPWARICDGRQLLYDDIPANDLLRLQAEVLEYSFSSPLDSRTNEPESG